MNKPNWTRQNRRQLLKTMGLAIAASPALGLLGCGGGSSSDNDSTAASDDSTTDNTDTDTDTTTDTSSDSDWVSGGTAAMEADFPPSDPFISGLGNLCTVTSSYTLGPCYYNVDDYRDDISEDQLGVPMALVLKLVDSSCEPIAGADIEIWFCNRVGIYSGDTSDSADSSSFNTSFCTDNNSAARASRWFRGVQTTDSDGLVFFKACFPGWYPSRTTHIHFKVVRGSTTSLVSQFCFEDDLANDIYQNHEDYTGEAKDTSNARDTVFDADSYEEYMFAVERQYDGSMLAYKAIQLS